MDQPVDHGDMLVETEYSEYKDFDGIQFPVTYCGKSRTVSRRWT